MRKLLLLLFLCGTALAQKSLYVRPVLSPYGQALPNATVYVCTLGVVTGSACAGTTKVTIYTDSTGTSTITQPTFSDANGNLSFGCDPGNYIIQITTAGGSLQYTDSCSSTTSNQQLPVEQFGAVGDWNGAGGTDNTAAIQACINALSAGSCILQAKAYKVTGSISITKSAIGISGTCSFNSSPTIYTAPACSQIVSTSASADIIDVTGVSTSNNLAFNSFRNFTISRSVAPSGTAAGLRSTYTYGMQIDSVQSQDSIYGFYFHGTGGQGTGYIRNSAATWGANGVSETSGNLAGFYVDSANGEPSNSIFFENDIANNYVGHGGGGVTTKGFAFVGTATHDFQLHSPQTANTDYGLYLSCTSCSGILSSTDQTVSNAWFDTALTSAVYINGIQGGIMMSNGLYRNATGSTTPIVDIESSINVSIVNPQVIQLGTGSGSNNYGILANFSTGTNIVSAVLGNTAAAAVNTANSAKTNIVGISASCACTSVVTFSNSTNSAMASGQINGTATNGILIDATSTVAGLETVSIVGPTTLINDSNNNFPSLNGIGILHSSSGTMLCTPKAPTVTAGFNAGTMNVNNGSCAFSITVGTGSAGSTGTITFSPAAAHGWNCSQPANLTHTGAVIMETGTTTTTVSLTNYGTTPGTPVNWTNGDVIGISCFAD